MAEWLKWQPWNEQVDPQNNILDAFTFRPVCNTVCSHVGNIILSGLLGILAKQPDL